MLVKRLISGILVCALALYLLLILQGSMDTYKPATPPPIVDRPGSADRLTSSVVLVVIDGLRQDTSLSLPFVNQLRGQGAGGPMRTGEPSFSKPSYAVISSGAWQETTGVLLNSSSGPAAVDTVFNLARRHGLRVDMAAHEWWVEVNGAGAFSDSWIYGDDVSHDPAVDIALRDQALGFLSKNKPDILLVHFSNVDARGHDSGAASQQYKDAAMTIDSYVRQIASAMDLTKQTLIVTADHGHLDVNNGGGSGHGGWEKELTTVPFVMMGAGIRKVDLKGIEQVDVAPTVAALLGLPALSSAEGEAIWDGLTATPQYRAAVDRTESRKAALQDARAARESRTRRERLVRGAEVAAGVVVLAFLLRRMNRTGAALAASAAVSYVALYWFIYAVAFKDAFSLAVFPASDILTLVRLLGVPALISILVIHVVLPRAGYFRDRLDAAQAADAVTLGTGAFLATVVAIGYVVNGAKVTWRLPNFMIGFLQLSALLQLALVGLTAWVAPLLVQVKRRRSH